MNFANPGGILRQIIMESEPRISANSAVYNAVIDDVMEELIPVFLKDNVDCSVLLELKRLWKAKLCLKDDDLGLAKSGVSGAPEAIAAAVANLSAEPPTDNQLQLLHVKDGVSTWSFNNDLMKKILDYSNKSSCLGVVISVPKEDGSAAPPPATQVEPSTCALQMNSSKSSKVKSIKRRKITQVDGVEDSSSDEESSAFSIESSEQNDNDDELDEEPLNSDDDVTETEDGAAETDNILVCQYEKISRRSNRWKLHLKAGIMNLNGEDYVFNRLTGEVLW